MCLAPATVERQEFCFQGVGQRLFSDQESKYGTGILNLITHAIETKITALGSVNQPRIQDLEIEGAQTENLKNRGGADDNFLRYSFINMYVQCRGGARLLRPRLDPPLLNVATRRQVKCEILYFLAQ